MKDQIAVYRIIGNALPPRDTAICRLDALTDILRAERECNYQPHYVLNHIHDSGFRAEVIKLLQQFGCTWVELTFEPRVFRSHTLEEKLLYAININVARNRCLRTAFKNDYAFALILDQDCYFHAEEWDAAMAAVVKDQIQTPQRKYYSFLTTRTHSVIDDLKNVLLEEPMLMFRHDAPRWFNPLIPFGKNDKRELCEWLGHHHQHWKVNNAGKTRIVGKVRHLSYGDVAADDLKVRTNLREQSLKVLMQQLQAKYHDSV